MIARRRVLQISRCLTRRGLTQVEAARDLDVPQSTLSKIMNGRVADLSLGLLIRIAVRAGLPIVTQTGGVPEEAGAYVTGKDASRTHSRPTSKLAQDSRDALIEAARKLTPEQGLDAMLEQTQLVSEPRDSAQRMRNRLATRVERKR